MGERITLDDVNAMKLTPASREKFLEWVHIDALRKAYIASARAEVARDE